ncbi:serine/arginine repetitive matrix protein 2-like isoform X3 [Pomacea canaliculata]|uniref:serine/arginine repetitive matrix protein 2-like isoform X3 n=1 Tax=Pomacea canaliculata TaxID=400727 RepID=UPI000D72A7E5|nr:serine/arginine repetitive matrix protein 2-like isoform X3 [Pomacea canaliculata]XP_025092136.1 serine/arginine repetitive matrix protein 2-like isoform X3 [Pomacea canaliculata]
MYNGIGLTTPRGSGTNGFVQRNLSSVKRQKDRVDYRTEEDVARLEKQLNRQPNADILYHDRKRRVELKCMEMQELMEEQGYSAEEITQKVSMFRKMLMDKEGVTESSMEKDEHGRPLAKETHQLAEANQEKNQRLREAFGLNDYVDGSSFDPNRKAKEEAAKATAMATKKYSIVQSSGSEEEGDEEPKKKKKRSRRYREEKRIDESASPDRRKKRKKSKKHRHNRSELRKHKRSKKKPKKRRDEKPKKRSHDSSSSDDDSDSQSESDSGSEKEEDQGKIPEVTSSASRGRAAARSLTPANKRHDSSSDSDTVKTRNGNEKTSTRKNGHLSPRQKKRDHSRSLSYSPACKQPPSSESYNYTNGRSKTSDKKQNAKARSRTRSNSPSQSKISSQTSKNSTGADGKAQRQRSPKRSRTKSRSHSRERSRKSESIEKRRARSRSCSRSRSYSRSFSRSRSRNRTPHRVTRSPSIRRRHGSPSHLDKRRITRSRSQSYNRNHRRRSHSQVYRSRSRSRSPYYSSRHHRRPYR